MPVYCGSSSQKPSGFSIDNLIKDKTPAKTSHPPIPSVVYLPPPSWTSLQFPNFHQHQHESMFQYLRQTDQFTNSMAALLLHSYRKPKRNRTAFTPSQLLKLENAFEKNPYIVGQERKDLARNLNLPEARVKVWYQNRRTKQKRLSSEDGRSSTTNEVDNQNEPDLINKSSDEHLWINNHNFDETNSNQQQEKFFSD